MHQKIPQSIMKVIQMKSNTQNVHTCIHEKQVMGQSRKIAELEVRADYKDKRIDELLENNKKLDEKIDGITNTLNQYIADSKEDDNTLTGYINKLENRVTALEADKENTRYMLGLTALLLVALEFALKYLVK